MNNGRRVPPISLKPDLLIFLTGTLLQFLVVYSCVPFLSRTGIMKLGSWMILSIPLIFVPIILAGWWLLRKEASLEWRERLRLRKLGRSDWLWVLAGLVVMGGGSGLAFKACITLGLDSNPPFARHAQAWTEGHHWMFAMWAFYWPFNILGENFVWRGVILPRMEARLGQYAWLLNALLWGVFHLAFGLGNLIVLLPTLAVVPFVAQRTRNTWPAAILHASLSGPGFMALAFGAY